MKKNVLPLIGVVGLLFLSSCKENSNNVKENPDASNIQFEDNDLTQVWEGYLNLKTALVNDDKDRAAAAANDFAAKQKIGNELQAIAKNIADASTIDLQRELFTTLTAKVEPILANSLKQGKIYQQYCPMAFNNTGAYWLSDSSDILNPYFGDQMLKCGKVNKTYEN